MYKQFPHLNRKITVNVIFLGFVCVAVLLRHITYFEKCSTLYSLSKNLRIGLHLAHSMFVAKFHIAPLSEVKFLVRIIALFNDVHPLNQ